MMRFVVVFVMVSLKIESKLIMI